MDDAKTFKVENGRLIFRNFSGREGPYNREGDRNFSVVLDHASAEKMLQDGWNVKYLQPQEEGDETTPYISVNVNFKNRPPRVVMITSTSRTNLDENSIGVLDWADIEMVDLICRSYEWAVGAKSGVKAYLKTMFITINEDDLERKYAVNESQ